MEDMAFKIESDRLGLGELVSDTLVFIGAL